MSARARMRPSEMQELLLRAALSPDREQAARALGLWLSRVEIDALDVGSTQMLPLLDLADVGSEGRRVAGQVRHIARFTWLRTQMLAMAAAPAIRGLSEAGLEPVLSKGAALVFAHGIDQRRRPMMDIDIDIAPRDLRRAVEVLLALGFTPEIRDGLLRFPDRMVRDNHAIGFHGERGAALDLHWHLLHTARNPAVDEAFRAAASACEIAGVRCRATSREDTLVITIVHGSRWARGAAVRWAGDVALLVDRYGDELDWDAVVRRAREVRVSVLVADALDYLDTIVPLSVPPGAIAGLRRAPRPLALRLRRSRRDAADGGPRAPGRFAALVEAYEEDAAGSVRPGSRTGAVDFGRFLARRWGLRGARRVPLHALWVATGRPWRPRRLARTGLTRDMSGWLGAWLHYELGTLLSFSDDGDGHQRLGPGWWFPEPHGIWSRAHCAWVLLPLAAQPPVDRLLLELEVVAAIAPGRPRQRVDVVFCDRPVASVDLDARSPRQRIAVAVPAESLGSEVVAVVAFRSDPVIAPVDSRLSSDLRQLGVGLSRLRLAACGPED